MKFWHRLRMHYQYTIVCCPGTKIDIYDGRTAECPQCHSTFEVRRTR